MLPVNRPSKLAAISPEAKVLDQEVLIPFAKVLETVALYVYTSFTLRSCIKLTGFLVTRCPAVYTEASPFRCTKPAET